MRSCGPSAARKVPGEHQSGEGYAAGRPAPPERAGVRRQQLRDERVLWGLRCCRYGRGRFDGGADERLDIRAKPGEGGRFAVPLPRCQIRRVHGSKAQRRPDILDHHRNQDAPLIPLARLVVDPVPADRDCRPQHHDAARLADLLFDDQGNILAGPDVAVPPNGPAVGFERLGDGFGARTIFAGVADEDVAHRMNGPGRGSLLATRGPGPFCCSAPKAILRSPGARPGSGVRTPAAAMTTAAPAAGTLARARSTSRTQRKPMLLFLLSGAFLLRLAARRFLVSLLNEPPRNTRTLDRTPFSCGRAGLKPHAG